MNSKTIQSLALLGCGLLGGVAVVTMMPSAFALQPAMQSALDNLNDAERNLQNATNDKGGHRNKALRAVRDAQREVRAGIKFDRRH